MADRSDTATILQLVGVFVAALLIITAFEYLRADIATGRFRVETIIILGVLVAVGLGYWFYVRDTNAT